MSQSDQSGQSNQMNVDVPAVLGAITQLGALSTSLNDLAGQMQDGGNLAWTGADKSGVALYDQLAPAEQAGVQAVADTKTGVDGLIDNLATTAGLWKNTESTNIELNQ